MRAALLSLALIVPVIGTQKEAASPSGPEPIAGIWKGEARTGSQSAEVAFEIRAVKDGLGLYTTLPRLHAWRMPVGYLTSRPDGSWTIPDWHVTLKRRGDTLTGELGDPRVTFTAARAGALPAEPPMPAYPEGPAPDWTYNAGAPLWASPASLGGIVYAADARGTLHAVRAGDGSREWTSDIGAPVYGAALATGNALFVFDDRGILHKLERREGRELWRAALGTPAAPRVLPAADAFDFDFHAPSPVLRDGVVYVPSGAGTVHAVDAATGRFLWRAELKSRVRAGVAVSGSRVFAGTLDNDLVALERTSGKELWRFKATGPVTSAPVVAGDLVIFANRGSWITALNAANGKPVWHRYDWFSWIESDGVLRDGLYYVGSSDLRAVRALEPGSGKTVWETDVLGWAWGTPAIAGDMVYIGVAAPRKYVTRHAPGLVGLDRKTGAVRWRRAATPAADAFVSGYPGSVVVSDGTLVAPNVSGLLEGYKGIKN